MAGPSIIKAFGELTGGKLSYYPCDDGEVMTTGAGFCIVEYQIDAGLTQS